MIKVEVCVDNLESLVLANQFPIQRIELCSALSVGGLSPSYGVLKQAVDISTIPIAVMVRPRAGDFLFNAQEIKAMQLEIELANKLGVKHIVIGALTANADLDLTTIRQLVSVAEGMEVTFHRAFDLCRNPFDTLEQLVELGIQRILTSGQASNALLGCALLQQLVKQANQRIDIMAGCGINAENVQTIIKTSQVPQIHCSAKGVRLSKMNSFSSVAMGQSHEQDQKIDVLDPQKLNAILQQIGSYK